MYKLITFDIYSACLDILGSAIPRVSKTLALDKETATAFFKMWREQQWNYLLLDNSMRQDHRSYRYITERTLEYVATKYSKVLDNKSKKELMDIWVTFQAWPETRNVIEEIRHRGYQVAMLSNGDRDMLKPLVQSTGIAFDYIFSAEQAGAYKPDPGVYDIPFQETGIPKEDMLHVAGSVFDVMGAKAAGCNCVWSNRFHDKVLDPRFEPDYNLSNLEGLLDIL